MHVRRRLFPPEEARALCSALPSVAVDIVEARVGVVAAVDRVGGLMNYLTLL